MKRIIIHIGPHKTGSTALQQSLIENRETLLSSGILFLHDGSTHNAALQLVQENFEAAEQSLRDIERAIEASVASTIIMSQEDFCGDLPGRSRRKSIYPKITKNLRIISRALNKHQVKFVFFEREENDWMLSCYHQHLKHRTHFSDLKSFKEHFNEKLSWEEILSKPKNNFKNNLITVPYSKEATSGVRAILNICGSDNLVLPHSVNKKNLSPEPAIVRNLERINALSSFPETAWFSKTLVMKNWQPRPSINRSEFVYNYDPTLAKIALPHLTQRSLNRVYHQEIDDILPDTEVDLTKYIFDLLPVDVQIPSVSRAKIKNQSVILDYHLRGKSKLAKLNALTISYLRRHTRSTEKARHLFLRIWREQGHILINELSTRWLISTLQTFLEHGENEAQRLIGASGYFYANMMKIYEGERAIEGRDQDLIYPNTEPQTPNKFRGLDRYNVGGTDLLLNTNALALDLAIQDDVAGIVLIELLLRVKLSANVFTRMDKTRKNKRIDVPEFSDTWSFFEPKLSTGVTADK